MAKFIEVSNERGGTSLLNVDYIFEVERDSKSGNAIIKMAVNGYNKCPFYYVETNMEYWNVRRIVDDSMQT